MPRFRMDGSSVRSPGAFCGQRMRSPGGAYDREIRKFLGHLVAIGRIEPLEPAPEEKGASERLEMFSVWLERHRGISQKPYAGTAV